MSKYTTEVRYICETAAGLTNSEGYNSVEDIIYKALPSVFNFTFPIFDESYRSVIETKILKHFYTREIGFETVGLWKLKLNTKLNEIMPYYNKLYKSELLEFNPLYDVDLTRKHKIEGNGKKDSDTTITSNLSNSETTNGTNNKSNDNTIKTDLTATAVLFESDSMPYQRYVPYFGAKGITLLAENVTAKTLHKVTLQYVDNGTRASTLQLAFGYDGSNALTAGEYRVNLTRPIGHHLNIYTNKPPVCFF